MPDLVDNPVDRRTVADAIEDTKRWRENIEEAIERGERWGPAALEQVEQREQALDSFDPGMLLLSFAEALQSDLLSDEEKWIVRWQHMGNYWSPSTFEEHLIHAIEHADEANLDKLARGWPVAVNAIRQWRGTKPTPHGGSMGRRLRSLPLDFSI